MQVSLKVFYYCGKRCREVFKTSGASEFLGEQFSISSLVKLPKSGGAMAPLAPLLTTALKTGLTK